MAFLILIDYVGWKFFFFGFFFRLKNRVFWGKINTLEGKGKDGNTNFINQTRKSRKVLVFSYIICVKVLLILDNFFKLKKLSIILNLIFYI